MRSFWAAAFLVIATAGVVSAADPKDPLVRARLLYNERQFEAAITAADEARKRPDRADSADLIAARALLERHRESAAEDDLTAARERLRRIDPERLGARERIELVVGLGEALFFDDSAGAAAGVFESVLSGSSPLDADARERVLDWWASALDQEARNGVNGGRAPIYLRIHDRMLDELGRNAASATALYWLSA